MNDYSKPRRMGLNAFFITFIKVFKSILGVTLIYASVKIFGSDLSLGDSAIWLRIIYSFAAMTAISLLLTSAEYLPKKFHIKDRNLIFKTGIIGISRLTTTIPLDRIHSLRTKQGLWYRLLGMRGIILDTLATKGVEIELILDESDWKSLLLLIDSDECTETACPVDTPAHAPASVRHFSNKHLLADALCQNHLKGMAVLGSILAVIIDHINDFSDNAIDQATDYTMSFFDSILVSPLILSSVLIAAYLIVLSLWLGKVFLRYGDMTLRYDNRLMTFTSGLLSLTSSRFAFDKVCTIWVKRNFLEKRFGLSSLVMRQAFNATAMKEDDNLKLYGADTSAFFLKWWLGEDFDKSRGIISAKSGRGAFFHTILPGMLISVAASIALCHHQLHIWLIIPLTYLLITVAKGVCTMKHSRITLKETYLVVHDGHFAGIENYIKYGNIEVVEIRRTPLTALFHRVSLAISTSGSTYTIRSIPEKEAVTIRELLLLKTMC